jgi:hypothetical protein
VLTSIKGAGIAVKEDPGYSQLCSTIVGEKPPLLVLARLLLPAEMWRSSTVFQKAEYKGQADEEA